jgi:hypothetical protein
MYGYYYVYPQGATLQSDARVLSDTVAEIFKDDLQGRLLSQAGSEPGEDKEVVVVLVTDVVMKRRMVPNAMGFPTMQHAPGNSDTSKEIILGRVIKTAETHECRHPDGDTHTITVYHEPFEMIRAEVPEQYGKKSLNLPSFKD